MLEASFTELVEQYTGNQPLRVELWQEIAAQYQHPKRYYHNLAHLEHMRSLLQPVQHKLDNADAVWFALFYHDIVYKVSKTDNEEKSAAFAAKRMQALSVPEAIIENCTIKIQATQYHTPGLDADTDYFTDADLAILGQPRAEYEIYCKKIRKEYGVYPDILYKPGRKKVLQHFLQMERIFKTDWFADQFETQAKQNLQHELNALSSKQ